MANTYAINQQGIDLVERRLAALGVHVTRTGERGVHLFVRAAPEDDPKGLAVRAKLAPAPGGGRGRLSLDWWVDEDARADLIALTDLSTQRVWLMTTEEVRTLAQQHPAGSYHIFMYVEPPKSSIHTRILDSDFAEFLLPPSGPGEWRTRVGGAASAALDESVVAVEGDVRMRLVRHRYRERSLRDAKINAVLKATGGRLQCEVPGCRFDFAARYGVLGEGYAHVHHLKPLAEAAAPVETRLEDLAIVCANCHAMIHVGGQCRPLADVTVHA